MKAWIFLAFASIVMAGTPPIIYEIANEKEASSLSATCVFTTEDENNVKCDFVQISLRQSDIDTEKQIHESFSEINKMSKAELKKSVLSVCNAVNIVSENTNKDTIKLHSTNELKKACLSNDYVLIAQTIARSNIISNANKCKISHNEYEMEFKRMGKYKWVSDSSPKGTCEISTVATLESKNGYAWKYTQVRMGIGNDSLELCKVYEIGKAIIYSWDAETEFSLKGCRVISFGGF